MAEIGILVVGILILFALGVLLGPDRIRKQPDEWECPDTFPEEWTKGEACST